MKKFMVVIALSFLLAMGCGCSLYASRSGTGYPPDIGGPQEYGSEQEYGAEMDYNEIYNYLDPYGNWINHAAYGYVWTPRNMGYRWRPYSNGQWVMTDDGWTWLSHDEWGSIPFHYGRWGYDEDFGWFWVPGTTWGPAWVSWRVSDLYVGWAPLPPGTEFSEGTDFASLSFRIPHRFWVFLQAPHFLDRDINRYSLPYERNVTIINFTTIHNDIQYRNNRYINQGIGIERVRRLTGRSVPHYNIRDSRERGRAKVKGNDVHFFRPKVRMNAIAKPKTFMDRDQARRELASARVFESRSQASVKATEAIVRRRQAEEKAIFQKTQKQEVENMKRKRDKEMAQIRDKAEKKKISQLHQDKIIKLQEKHKIENQKLIKRTQKDLERVKQIAHEARLKQQKQTRLKGKSKN